MESKEFQKTKNVPDEQNINTEDLLDDREEETPQDVVGDDDDVLNSDYLPTDEEGDDLADDEDVVRTDSTDDLIDEDEEAEDKELVGEELEGLDPEELSGRVL